MGQPAHLRTRSQGCRTGPPTPPLTSPWGWQPRDASWPSRRGQALSSGVPADTLLTSPIESSIPQPLPAQPSTVCPSPFIPDNKRAGFSGCSGRWARPDLPEKDLPRGPAAHRTGSGIWTGLPHAQVSAPQAVTVLAFPRHFARDEAAHAGRSPQPVGCTQQAEGTSCRQASTSEQGLLQRSFFKILCIVSLKLT